MADKMWLIHEQSGIGVCIGAHTGKNWVALPLSSNLELFYDYLSKNHSEHSYDIFNERSENPKWKQDSINDSGMLTFKRKPKDKT